MAAHGPKILLLCLEREIQAAQRQLLYLAEALKNSDDFSVLLLCAEHSEIAAAAEKADIPFQTLPGQGALSPVRLLSFYLALRRERPLIVHTHDEKALTLAAFFKRGLRTRGRVLLHSRHNAEPISGMLRKRRYQAADAIACSSRYAAGMGVDAGIPKNRFFIIRPGLNPEKSAFPEKKDLKRFIFLVAGATDERYGYKSVLHALAPLMDMHELPPWEIRFIGPGPIGSLLDLARELKIDHRISMFGPQDIERMLAETDCLIFVPDDPAAHPEPLMLAWKYDSSLICSDLPHFLEIITGTDSALTCPAGDPEALSRKMVRIMSDPELRRNLREKGRANLEERTHLKMANAYIQLYRKLLRDRNLLLGNKPGAPSRPAYRGGRS